MAPAWERKRYKLVSSENFEELLKEFGLNYMMRKMAAKFSHGVELIKDGDNHYILRSYSMLKDYEYPFTPDVEFLELKPDNSKVRTIYTFREENTLYQEQFYEKFVCTVLREFTETESVWTLKVNDVVCVRRFALET